MAESSEDFREALLNIARQARSLVDNFNDGNVQPIEQRMLSQRRHETGVLSTRTPSSQTGNVNMESTPVSTQLRNLFPTFGKRSFGGKSSESNLVKVNGLPPKNQRKI